MNYELAKELKDAGFGYNQKRILRGDYQKVYAPAKGEMLSGEYEYAPSLEELIEACETRFNVLNQRGLGADHWEKQWHASSEDTLIHVFGDTPTEAVARLFLSLNSVRISSNRKPEKKI